VGTRIQRPHHGGRVVSAPYWQSPCGRIVLHHGDCREVMATLADKSIDHVITDPPYSEHVHAKSRAGTNVAGSTRKSAAKGHGQGAGSMDASRLSTARDLGFAHLTSDVMTSCADHFDRLARRWVLVFSDVESTHLWRGELVASGLDYVRTGAWIKEGGTPQFTGDRPAVGFEAITICHPSGKKKWNGGGSHGVWSFPVVNGQADETRVHTTQKPARLMRKLVALFTDPNDLILDPFAGSGTTLVAAYEQGRRALGVEMDEKNAEAAAKRLTQMCAQGSLFAAGAK
jgi:hypothetical protein